MYVSTHSSVTRRSRTGQTWSRSAALDRTLREFRSRYRSTLRTSSMSWINGRCGETLARFLVQLQIRKRQAIGMRPTST